MAGAAFAWLGAVLVLGGVVAILTGVPAAAHDLRPIGGFGDIGPRLGELSLLLSAATAAVVVGVVGAFRYARRLRAQPAALELFVLGAAIEVSVLGCLQRVAWSSDGTVMPAAVACVTGGAAILAGSFVTQQSGD